MNILKANYVDLNKMRKFRKIFSDVSERDLEEGRVAADQSDARIKEENQ
jgi:hypothetical protein